MPCGGGRQEVRDAGAGVVRGPGRFFETAAERDAGGVQPRGGGFSGGRRHGSHGLAGAAHAAEETDADPVNERIEHLIIIDQKKQFLKSYSS